jgi:argininosuccinate synthase
MRASETAARRIVVVDDGRSVISETIAWLRRHYSAEIVSVVMDVGQPLDPGRLRDEAVESGAVRAHVLDLRGRLRRIPSSRPSKPTRCTRMAGRSSPAWSGR